MLILIAFLALGAFLFSRVPRLEAVSEVSAEKTVRAYVDGKPVRSYVLDENSEGRLQP
ncbi:MAG: hypothetical protein IKE81_01460 [Clostridia bacterium]|jgi:hypothetical protein|nr:hypothetical protein [Clostridia bacterium]